MAGFRRILCASDLSEAADWAIRAADGEARWHGAELVVLHVMPVTYPGAHHTLEFERDDHPWVGDVVRWVEKRL